MKIYEIVFPYDIDQAGKMFDSLGSVKRHLMKYDLTKFIKCNGKSQRELFESKIISIKIWNIDYTPVSYTTNITKAEAQSLVSYMDANDLAVAKITHKQTAIGTIHICNNGNNHADLTDYSSW